MLKKMELSKEEEKIYSDSKAAQSVNFLKECYCLVDIDSSCFEFFPGEFDGGIVRCKPCFAMVCEKNPALSAREPKSIVLRQIEKVPGNSFATGLVLSKERTELLITGGN